MPRPQRAGTPWFAAAVRLLQASGLAVLIAGCASSPAIPLTRLPADIPPGTTATTPAPQAVPSTPPVVARDASRPAVPPVVLPPSEPPSVAGTNGVAAPLPTAPPTPVVATNRWIRLADWFAAHPEMSGKVAMQAGSKRFQYAGVTAHLGFEPLPAGNTLLLHPIDVARNLDPLTEATPAWTGRRIVLDPGHGGISAGTRMITGNRFEKDFTLDWARRLKPLLEARGWTVVLTRTNDVDVSLPERVHVADLAQADLFVSLHFNSSFPSQTAQGLETYCLTPTGLPSTLVRQYADDPASVHPNNRHDAANLRLALRIHRSVLRASGQLDRGVRRARFMDVLRGQDRPAVLIEGGYLSNPAEARRIDTPEFRQRLALGVAAALE